jgi:hypothetical protein
MTETSFCLTSLVLSFAASIKDGSLNIRMSNDEWRKWFLALFATYVYENLIVCGTGIDEVVTIDDLSEALGFQVELYEVDSGISAELRLDCLPDSLHETVLKEWALFQSSPPVCMRVARSYCTGAPFIALANTYSGEPSAFIISQGVDLVCNHARELALNLRSGE